MGGKSFTHIIPVWITYAISWILQFTMNQWMDAVILLKELIALIGFILAAGYTLYKFKRDWKGWNPKKSKDQINKQ